MQNDGSASCASVGSDAVMTLPTGTVVLMEMSANDGAGVGDYHWRKEKAKWNKHVTGRDVWDVELRGDGQPSGPFLLHRYIMPCICYAICPCVAPQTIVASSTALTTFKRPLHRQVLSHVCGNIPTHRTVNKYYMACQLSHKWQTIPMLSSSGT